MSNTLDKTRAFRKEADSRSHERMLDLEADRILAQAYLAGIPDDSVYFDLNALTCALDLEWYSETGHDREVVATKIFNDAASWATKGTIVMIDGGAPTNIDLRRLVGGAIAIRGIMANIQTPDRIAEVVNVAEIVPIISSFNNERLDLAERLKRYPVLMLAEFDPEMVFSGEGKNAGEGRTMLESILVGRRSRKRPTIITLAELSTSFETKTGTFGKTFESAILSGHDENRGIWRLRLTR